jgi:hypothetical protein
MISTSDSNNSNPILIHISDLLSTIAMTETGKKLILHQSLHEPPSRSILKVVTSFVKNGIETEGLKSNLNVLGGFIFFLRQIYRTCDGSHCLEDLALHSILSKAVADSKSKESLKSDQIEWKTLLIDNILNFAGTPKGVLYLQQSNTMFPCVDHMFLRCYFFSIFTQYVLNNCM